MKFAKGRQSVSVNNLSAVTFQDSHVVAATAHLVIRFDHCHNYTSSTSVSKLWSGPRTG